MDTRDLILRIGAMPGHNDRGIALIEYDYMNNPKRIQFTNGNVTKYIYFATGEKLRTIYQTAVPNITVAMGSKHELTDAEVLYKDSVNYYHGGKLTVKNGRLDKCYFDGGYAQAYNAFLCMVKYNDPHHKTNGGTKK